jgi:S1-C subfamily serine protease
VSSSGYIISNAHVVDDSTNLEAVFSSGLTLPLQLVRINPKADVALLKIPGSGYVPLSLDTTLVTETIGSDVVAIGTPKDVRLGQTVTKGIISGMREFDEKIYIQTDVSINGGNSGGPLINKKGQVVGIVTSKRKDSEGLGFAIPIVEGLRALNIALKN